MDRSPNRNAAIRERVNHINPDPNGPHSYVWPYDTNYYQGSNVGAIMRCYQADVAPHLDPPFVEVVHIEDVSTGNPIVRNADLREVSRMVRLIEEDFGPQAAGLQALQAFVVDLASKE